MIKSMLKFIGFLCLLFIAVSFLYGVLGLKQARNLSIEPADLSRIPDGTYTGIYENYRWTNTVEVTVRGHQITAIEPVSPLTAREELTASLTRAIIERHTNAVDAVSGATASSNAFLKAVENALKNAGC
ncbi:MAG: FMN-binding protein [Clostridiales bacterium]|jgi:uncharacterized protein with FMN-binding domain|nr:FMN-binding protein [Clostridiales bacterium]